MKEPQGMTSIWSGWGPGVTLALWPSSCPMGPEMSRYICQVSCCWQVDTSRLTCSPQRGLHALHFLLGLQQVHPPPVSISLKGRRLGECETLLLPAGGGPRAQGLCAFSFHLSSLKAKPGEGCVALPHVQHTLLPPAEHTSPILPSGWPPRGSSKLVKNPIIPGPRVQGNSWCSTKVLN